MAQLIQLVKSAPTILTPATIEASDFVQRVKLGEWIQAEFRRVRNYQYHKRFQTSAIWFRLLDANRWCIDAPERELIDGFVGYLVEMSGQQHGEVITAVADEYLLKVGQLRTQEIALLKSFEPYRGLGNRRGRLLL